MVFANSSFTRVNTPEFDAYLRNLHETRVTIEVSFLAFLNLLINLSNGKQVVVPSKILESERTYIMQLAKKYNKFDFEFSVDSHLVDPVYDVITKLIRRSRKTIAYSLLDFIDYVEEHEGVLSQVKVHHSIAHAIATTAKQYHTTVPKSWNSLLHEDSESIAKKSLSSFCSTVEIKGKPFVKYKQPFQVYMFMLSEIKKGIDFEFLKLYDYLYETKQKVIRSNKLLELEEYISIIAEKEYHKKKHDVSILPLQSDTEKSFLNMAIEEWCSNLRRLQDLKVEMTNDFITFMKQDATVAQKELFKTGAYPEIHSLIYFWFNEDVPEEFAIR